MIELRNLIINRETHQVFVDGESIKLTPIEFDILHLLASNPGKVFSTDEIFEQVWHEKVYEANNTVMVHIRRLRGKMKDDSRTDKIITTVWGWDIKLTNKFIRTFEERMAFYILISAAVTALLSACWVSLSGKSPNGCVTAATEAP